MKRSALGMLLVAAAVTGCGPSVNTKSEADKAEPTDASQAIDYVTGRTQVDALNRAKKDIKHIEEVRERQMKEVLEEN